MRVGKRPADVILHELPPRGEEIFMSQKRRETGRRIRAQAASQGDKQGHAGQIGHKQVSEPVLECCCWPLLLLIFHYLTPARCPDKKNLISQRNRRNRTELTAKIYLQSFSQ